jgi:hypothetical protein
VNYLDAFLKRARARSQDLPEPPKPVSSVLAASGRPVLGVAPDLDPLPAVGDRPPCSDCGRTDWIVTVVFDDGRRFCSRCWP